MAGRPVRGQREAYAVVAAKISTLLAFATMARIKEKRLVNVITTASRANGALTKYKTRIDVVGRRDDRKVLMMLATTMRLSSS